MDVLIDLIDILVCRETGVDHDLLLLYAARKSDQGRR